ncbi:MAG: ZIP family metal transporter [Gemmatimonadota bacterium]|jgi:zinc transporter ZupT
MATPLIVLLYASIAALSAIPGGLVRWSAEPGRDRWLGWAYALAAGGMLGAAFVLTGVSDATAVAGAIGAVLGVGFIGATHTVTRLETLDLSRPDREDPTAGPRLVAIHALHACTEGVAIGVAMAVDLSLGVFMALAIAVHNVPEAALLSSATREQGASRPGTVGLVVLSNVGQPALAVATWLLATTVPASLPWVLGFAVGALLNLVMTELLPASYREAGSTSIALVASVALGLVVLLGGILP